MDSGFRYFFRTRELHHLENDQIPDDYESEVDDPYLQAQYRCCHALIDRYQRDNLKLIEIFNQNLFRELSYLPSGGQQIPESLKYQCLHDILEFTDSILSDECSVNQSKFLIAVTFGVIRYNDEAEEDADGETTMEVNELRFVPASKSAIEALENVSGLDSECVICLGNFAKQTAKRMPCGHVYHGDCIVQWLEKSHLCPLCRHAMPVDS
ncbi:hypothetical protein CRYUN_Cryun35bG0070400 [Craigia yunnanensis]